MKGRRGSLEDDEEEAVLEVEVEVEVGLVVKIGLEAKMGFEGEAEGEGEGRVDVGSKGEEDTGLEVALEAEVGGNVVQSALPGRGPLKTGSWRRTCLRGVVVAVVVG